jgi:hypothetical protein
MRRQRATSTTGSSSGEFPEVEIPDEVLERARREAAEVEAFAGVDVVEDYLREVHGPMPDHRDDRDRWLRWVEAVEERALAFLEDALARGEETR